MEYKVVNPYDQSTVGTFVFATRDEVSAAIARLNRGKRVLAEMSAYERSVILHKVAGLIEKHTEELAVLVAKEIGKTVSEARIEMQRAQNTFLCAGDEARRIGGEVLDSDSYPPARGKWGIVQRKALGIVLAITPFNFPINLSAHKLGPAFAAGCPVFFKPGPQNYFSGQRLTALCHEAGMPEEALQCCVPDIPALTELIEGDEIQVISFTGGVPTAKAISRNAGGKKLLFELGGNDPLIVMDDADIALAVKTAVNQRFGTSGQRCTAAKRIFVQDGVFAAFRDQLVAATKELVVGDPLAEETFVGPVINAHAADLIEKRIQMAIADGATLLIGGKREGNIIYPTVLSDVTAEMELCADETFGPVIPLFRFAQIEEIVPIINGTGFGLQSGVFTNQLDVVKYLYKELEVGALAVNDGPGFRAEHFPFGGVKNSGLGREGVRYAIEEFTYLKTLIF